MSYKTVIRLIAVFIAVLLLYAAVGQLEQYTLFCMQLQKFLPARFPVQQIAWIIPLTTFSVALLLLMPSFRVSGLFAALFLLNLYTMGLTVMLDDQYAMPCHCGEPLQRLSLATHIVFNLLCVGGVCVAVGLSGRRRQSSIVNREFSEIVNREYSSIVNRQ